MNLQNIFDLMDKKGVASASDLVGVGLQEIADMEAYFALAFPQSYREFLMTAGRSAGFLSPWMAFYFDDLKEIHSQFETLNRQRETPIELPENALLIASCESVFDYIVCADTDNPAVYRFDLFTEPKPRTKRVAANYVSYLKKLVESSDSIGIPEDFFEDGVEFLDDVINY